jgi:hypothetical protein
MNGPQSPMTKDVWVRKCHAGGRRPATIVIAGHADSWRAILKLRRQQIEENENE